jgi:hypothetical protein
VGELVRGLVQGVMTHHRTSWAESHKQAQKDYDVQHAGRVKPVDRDEGTAELMALAQLGAEVAGKVGDGIALRMGETTPAALSRHSSGRALDIAKQALVGQPEMKVRFLAPDQVPVKVAELGDAIAINVTSKRGRASRTGTLYLALK